jgi:predicted phage terminase large subunit-like protein
MYQASQEHLTPIVARYATKFAYFAQNGYKPHIWQTLFHGNTHNNNLTRFRHLVAGRRGGKTLSAAFEVAYYAMFPEQFFIDAHGRQDDRALWIWVLTKDHKVGRPALVTFLQVLRDLGLVKDVDYRYNKTEKIIEFTKSESIVEFRSADDPENLRGAGLDILWIDEAALLSDETAWNVVRPSLSDKMGLVITTTTPQGKNWFYEEFWSNEALNDPNNGRVEYRSLDNPYFRAEEWEYIRKRYHPLMFQQEYMASFDSMAGRDLSGEWLHYYELKDLPKSLNGKGYDLKLFIGVDPAISLADSADRFVMSLVGVDTDYQAYLIDQYAGRIPFPEQVEKIAEWHNKYRPMLIGVEATAYQAALVQQTVRLPTMPPIIPMMTKGKKMERIMSMAPLFRIGRVKIRKTHMDFIDEWLNYDSSIKNPKDDCLDSVEIALRLAGALLPENPSLDTFDRLTGDIGDWARADRQAMSKPDHITDIHLGDVL